MKISINKTVTSEVEIELPVYRVGIAHAYKVFSDDYCIQVHTSTETASIGIHSSSLAFYGETERYCSKEEFEKKYNEALSLINSKL